MMPVSVDGEGVRLAVIIHKPARDGRFPTLIFHHGSTGGGTDPSLFAQPFDPKPLAEWFTARGWAVVLPARREPEARYLLERGLPVKKALTSHSPPTRIVAARGIITLLTDQQVLNWRRATWQTTGMASQVPSGERTVPILRMRQSDRRAASDRCMLDAATRLIAERGAAGTSLGDIGIAAGYSRGLPSERFGSKLRLLEALVDRSEAWFQRRLDVALAGKTGLDAALARIAAHFDGAMHDPMATAALYSLYVESISVLPALQPRIAALSNGFQRGFADHLREGQRLGRIRADVNCRRQAMVIVGAVRGLIIQSLIDRRPNDLQNGKKALLKLFDGSLRAS